ncbi:MAG: polysaccharide biosynthesis/export family protein, partial [Bdellovibrionales bacterium]
MIVLLHAVRAISLVLLLAPITAFAQGVDVPPWAYTTSEARNYNTFRSLQIDPALANPAARNDRNANYAPAPIINGQPQNTLIPTPISQNPKPTTPSALETMYAARIAQPLEQFGYDLFGVPNTETQNALGSAATHNTMPSGAVQDDFVLGQGDEIEVVFTGQRRDQGVYKVNNRGQIIIPDLPPIPASGRTIGQLRISIEAAARNLHNTEAYVSLASVRQIGALVIGHVKRPGRKNMTVFHTVLDALMDSGGITKTGSLRQIKLVRDGRSMIVDLYALLLHGQSAVDLRLRDGDRIIVPAIGPTVAIAGEIKRPGIFEIQTARRGMLFDPGQNA